MIHYKHIIMARITSYLLFFGVFIPSLLVVYDQFLGPLKHFKETPLGIYQTKLTGKIGDILDPATGKLKYAGYALGGEDTLRVNFEDARSISKEAGSISNRLRYRAWNYILMTTPTHMIQFNFVDVFSIGDRGFCPSSLIILDKRDPRGTFKKVEEGTFTCAKFDRHTLFDFERPPTLEGNGGKLKMSITPLGNMKYRVRVQETSSIDLDLDLTFDYTRAPSQVYLTPLDADKQAYFATLKKPGLQALGSYNY